jgi:Fur family ferric uptake transcriptional regulator
MPSKDYNTKQRDFLTGFFRSNPGECFTIEETFRRAVDGGVTIGRTTVYRNLGKLARDGVILKHILPSGGACFQYLDSGAEDGEHYHLFCTVCGNVTHLECGHLNGLSKHMSKEHGFCFDKQKTVFYGRCGKCADGLIAE